MPTTGSTFATPAPATDLVLEPLVHAVPGPWQAALWLNAALGLAGGERAHAATVTDDSDPAAYVGRIFDYHRSHPDVLRLLLWEALHYGDSPVPDEEGRSALYDAKVASLSGAVEGARSETDVRHLLLTLIGLAAWPQITPQLTRLVLGQDPSAEQTQDQLREHLMDFAGNAIQTPASHS
jgi:hypothetical protein